MSVATLNVWISNLGEPCSIANDIGSGLPYAWSVLVLHCDGRVLNWSEGRYRLHHDDKWIKIQQHTPPGGTAGWWYEMIPTRDGHVEIEVPPGTYLVAASMHTWFVNGVLHGNWATDRAIVHACCGEDVCANLYASSFQPCNWIFQRVIAMLLENKAISPEDARRVQDALKALDKPEQVSPAERGLIAALERAFRQMEKPKPEKK